MGLRKRFCDEAEGQDSRVPAEAYQMRDQSVSMSGISHARALGTTACCNQGIHNTLLNTSIFFAVLFPTHNHSLMDESEYILRPEV